MMDDEKIVQLYLDRNELAIKETAEKLAYINMIEKVRALNEQIKAEGEKENEAAN